MSRGKPAAALARLQVIQGSSDSDSVTNLLLSDALAAEGEAAKAVVIVSGAPWVTGRLLFQGWYRYWPVGDYRRAGYAWETALLREPGNADARYWLEQALSLSDLKQALHRKMVW